MNKWLSIGITPPAILATLNTVSLDSDLLKAPTKRYKQRGARNLIFDYPKVVAEIAALFPNKFTISDLSEHNPDIHWAQFIKRLRTVCPEILTVLRSEPRGRNNGGLCFVYKIHLEEIPTLIKAQHDRKVAAEAARHRKPTWKGN